MPTPADTLEEGAPLGAPKASANGDRPLRDDLAGLDALELSAAPVTPLWLRAWRATWPPSAAPLPPSPLPPEEG